MSHGFLSRTTRKSTSRFSLATDGVDRDLNVVRKVAVHDRPQAEGMHVVTADVHTRWPPRRGPRFSRTAMLRALLRDPRDRFDWREANGVLGEVLEVISIEGDHEGNAVDHGRRDDVSVADQLARGRGPRKESE